jgi:hypothetical protein
VDRFAELLDQVLHFLIQCHLRAALGLNSCVRFNPHRVFPALETGGNGIAGEPGEFPFTRGIQPTMYRGRLWTMRQYAGMGDAEESNRRYKFLLANGTKG